MPVNEVEWMFATMEPDTKIAVRRVGEVDWLNATFKFTWMYDGIMADVVMEDGTKRTLIPGSEAYEVMVMPSLGEMADVLRRWNALGVTRAAIDYALDQAGY